MKARFCLFLSLVLSMYLFTACKKEQKDDRTPPLTADGLVNGKAGIQFATQGSFGGSTSFDVRNTAYTSAITKPAAGNASIRNITLETTELKNNTPNRKVKIDMVVANTATTTSGSIVIDLSVSSGTPPLAYTMLERYSTLLGTDTWIVSSGTLTITKLTAAEIEGQFSGTAAVYGNSTLSTPFTISNGVFAGRF